MATTTEDGAAQSALKVWAVIAPMTQLNTPYPATAYLTGFLRARNYTTEQSDLALELVLALMTPESLDALGEQCAALPAAEQSQSVRDFLHHFEDYRASIEAVIRFLQGRDDTLAHRIATRAWLPESTRFASIAAQMQSLGYDIDDTEDPLGWAFGALGLVDKAKHIATLYLNDLADVWRDAVDEHFEFVRYAEQLAASQPSFEPLRQALLAPPTLIDHALEQLTAKHLKDIQPDVVLLSVPFPGALYGALRIAKVVKANQPQARILLGGGFVNTELRDLNTPELFDWVDYVTLDAGERPLLSLLEHFSGQRSAKRLQRTFHRDTSGAVVWTNWVEPEVPFEQCGTPTWAGLKLNRYLSLLDMLNPMHRLWSDGRWNKLTVALGCYWKKCSFCDVSLDYISRYETASAHHLVDQIEHIIAETGQSGFHFVDEAAPPKALKALALELLRRNVQITWWGNIRFEKSVTPELAQLLSRSGCIALTGGLEVASDRLLSLMKKGVSVEQVACVTKSLSDAGIMVHAYLMYGFPTQTVQETVDALEYVRQLFENGCIQSGFFHRFVCTVHSPVGKNPQTYGIELHDLPDTTFARNDVGFADPSGVDHAALGLGLRKAIYNFMHGVGLEEDVRFWFDQTPFQVPSTTLSPDTITLAIANH